VGFEPRTSTLVDGTASPQLSAAVIGRHTDKALYSPPLEKSRGGLNAIRLTHCFCLTYSKFTITTILHVPALFRKYLVPYVNFTITRMFQGFVVLKFTRGT
jgi:hypothetical protein